MTSASLTVNDIGKIKDVVAARKLCDSNNVDYDNRDTLDELMEKLTLRSMSQDDNIEFPTLDEIDELDDLFSAAEICEEHNVNIEHLEQCSQIQERLKLEYWRRKGVSLKTEVSGFVIILF